MVVAKFFASESELKTAPVVPPPPKLSVTSLPAAWHAWIPAARDWQFPLAPLSLQVCGDWFIYRKIPCGKELALPRLRLGTPPMKLLTNAMGMTFMTVS
jgi:hypothetical protein